MRRETSTAEDRDRSTVPVHVFVAAVVRARRWFLVCRFVLLTLNLVVGNLVLATLVDKLLFPPIVVYRIWGAAVGVVSAGFFAHVVWRIAREYRGCATYTASELEARGITRTRDELLVALDLERMLQSSDVSFSRELALSHVEDLRRRLESVDPALLAGMERVRAALPLNVVLVALIAVLFFVPPFTLRDTLYKMLFARRPDIHGIFVHPKSMTVTEGESVDIRAIVMAAYAPFRPTLYLRTYGPRWQKVPLTASGTMSGNVLYRYTVSDIRRPIHYRIGFRGVVTRSYVLEPVVYPAVSWLRIEVRPPAYTGAVPVVQHSFNAMQYLVGTALHFTVGTTMPVAEVHVHENGASRPLNRQTDTTFYGTIIASRTTEVSFSLRSADGRTERERIRYTVAVLPDRSPSATLLTPDQDVLVDKAERLTVVYALADDVGLSGAELEYVVEGVGRSGRLPIVAFSTVTRSYIGEYTLDFSALPVTYGDVLAVRLRARDNDAVNGPKSGVSEIRRIELFSFERQHARLTEELTSIVSRTAELLAREIDLRSRMPAGDDRTVDLAPLAREHRAMGDEFRALAASAGELARRMEADPYTAADVAVDVGRYAESLVDIAERRNPELLTALERRDIAGAAREQDGIIEQLERLAAVGDRLQERQNMADVAQAAADAAEHARRLADALASADGAWSAEDRARFEHLLAEITRRFQDVVDLLSRRRGDLPDAYINRRDVSQLDPARIQSVSDRLADALTRGDPARALEAARELLASLDAVARTLRDAGTAVVSSDMTGVDAALGELETRLDRIIADQEALLRDTRFAERAVFAERLARQEADLERVRALVHRVRGLLADAHVLEEFASLVWYPRYAAAVYSVDRRMSESQVELESGRLLRSPQLFRESLSLWEAEPVPLAATLSTGTHAAVVRLTAAVHAALQELNALLDPHTSLQPAAASGGAMADRQRAIAGRTAEFAGGLRSFGQSSLMLSDEDFRRTGMAISAMGGAVGALEGGRFSDAAGLEAAALDALIGLRDRIGAMRSEIAGMRQLDGSPGGRRVRSSPGGRMGVLFQRVLLPSRDAYVPPRELREDIIRSLSEKYPPGDERAIRTYFRELLTPR